MIAIFNGKVGQKAFLAELRWKKSKWMVLLLSFILSGLPIGLAAGGISYAISAATMSTLTAILVALGIASIPISGPIAIGVIGAAIGTLGIFVYKNTKKGREGMSGPNLRGPIDIIGAYVAKIVYLPVAGFAMCDNEMNDDEYKFIEGKMEAWGYSNEYIQERLDKYKTLGIDTVKREIQNTRNVEGNSKYIKNNANLRELYKKSFLICKELERNPKQQDNPVEKARYIDWLCATLDIPKNVSDPSIFQQFGGNLIIS
ncbi:MAG: hypothetical protein LBK08_02485 [Treponema sp.]|jgi:uncharacterized membrane protein YebE (DUF533 family)|nr:hypothetical protein [Treponema sp.]